MIRVDRYQSQLTLELTEVFDTTLELTYPHDEVEATQTME